jgi:predicted PurR-regulated permease PerM
MAAAQPSRRSKAESSDRDFVRRVLIVALIAALLGVAWLLADVMLLFFGAILVALTLRTLGRQFGRAGLSEKFGVAAAALAILGITIAAVAFFGAEIVAQAQNLSDRLGGALAQLSQRLDASILKNINPAAEIAPLIPSFLSWGVSIGGAVLSLLLVLVGGFYLALEPGAYRDGAVKLVPSSYRDNANATLDDIGEALHRWIGGQIAAMAIVGVLTGLGLWIVGVQSPLALGVLAGLANFVPYIGSIAAAAVTLLIASGQGLEMLLWAAAVMIVVQQIESNVVTPLVVGRAVSIAPVTGLFAVVAIAVLFGPLGVLFGYPLAIVADIAIRRLYIRDALDEPVEILGDQAEKSSVAAA